jgi:asparagine synthase (glutamine-hydrolysing)
MCGIHLIVRKGNHLPNLHQMLEATSHRGPGHQYAEVLNDYVGIAANRLSISDVSEAAHQPIWSKDKNHVLIWNGEIYNHQDLRNELIDQGHHFQSHTDSEVLLHWLITNGTNGLPQIKGMYSLIFIDLAAETIHIGRDSSGQKPLYFHQTHQDWIFSSEVKGIISALAETPRLDQDQFSPYFYSRHALPDQTFFQGIEQFLPGKCITLNFQGEVINDTLVKPITPHESIDLTFEDQLKDTVLTHFQADVPVGMALSGGVDSSLLYALWYEETGVPLHAYTVNFEKQEEKYFRDYHYASLLIKKYPAELIEIHVSKDKFMEEFPNYVKSLDQPVGDSAGFLTWMMAKEAKKQVKVLISGAGADELFGGYNRHKAFHTVLQKPELYTFLKKNLPINWLPQSIKKTLLGLEKNPRNTFLNFSSLTNLPQKLQDIYAPYYPQTGHDYLNALEWDRTFYLVHDILKIHDQSCMAHGIEGRAPYLDPALLELRNHHFQTTPNDFLGKKWMKDALIKRNLTAIAQRKKIGFGLPFKNWLERDSNFRNQVLQSVFKTETLWKNEIPILNALNPNEMKQFFKQNPLILWNMWLLSEWLQQNFK